MSATFRAEVGPCDDDAYLFMNGAPTVSLRFGQTRTVQRELEDAGPGFTQGRFMTSLGNSQFVIHNSRSSKRTRAAPAWWPRICAPATSRWPGPGEYAGWRASLLP